MTYPNFASTSAQLFKRGQRVMPGGNSRTGVMFEPYPLYASHAEGCRVTDVDGATRIDCINNWSSLIHGHGNQAVLKALADQSQKLLAVGMPTAIEIDLATLLVDRLPGVDKIRFSNSGSEGVLMALRAARAFTGKDAIAKVEGAYHGNVDSIEISVAPSPKQWGAEAAPSSVPATDGIARSVLADTVVLPFNDLDHTAALLRAHGSTLAAVVVDPVVSRMGFVEATPAYLAMLRELTSELGIVLIFDEVFSFRVGYHGAQGRSGITPDLTALGKIIGGGLPVGATGGRADIMEVFDQTRSPLRVEHGGTYNANPMTMAAGLSAMEQMTPEAYVHLDRLGDRLREGLRDVLARQGYRGQVTGTSSLVGLLFSDKPFNNYRSLPLRQREMAMISTLHRWLLNHGVQIIPHGLMVLSTAMDERAIDEIVDAVDQGVAALHCHFEPDAA